MGMWVAVAIAGVIGVAVAVSRLFSSPSRSGDIDLGEVSESWLREQRAEKKQDRFS